MAKNLITEAQQYLSSRNKDKRRSQVLRIVAVLVVFVTVYTLILPAVTMSNEVECGMEEHIHTDQCWEMRMEAPQPELACAVGSAGETVIHTHDSYCYDRQGNLVCTLPEVEAHVHGPECYHEQRTLLCQEHQDPGHQHGASCYSYVRVDDASELPEPAVPLASEVSYICGMRAGEGAHRHTEECYPEERMAEARCGFEESEDVLDEEGNVTQQGHRHTEECYMVRVRQKLVCGQEESEDVLDDEGNVIQPGHRHSGSCYLQGDELCFQYGCRQHESAGHQHTDVCVAQATEPEPENSTSVDSQGDQWRKTLICVEEERQSGHIHTDDCYEINELFVCRKQVLQAHSHDESCYGESGAPICGKLEVIAHQHTEGCFTTPEGDEQETRVLVCGMEEHTHVEGCYVKPAPKDEETFYCGLNEHTHTHSDPDCYFESGELKCTLVEHSHDLTCLEAPVEVSEEPQPSEEPGQTTVGVELENLRFEYDTENFHMVYFLNGFAQVTEAPEELLQNYSAAVDPEPAPSGEMLVTITNQMVPLAFLPKLSLVVQDSMVPSVTEEIIRMAGPDSAFERESADVESGNELPLMGSEPVKPEPTEAPEPAGSPASAEENVVLLDPEMVQAEVVELSPDSEEYQEMAAYAAELSEDQNTLDLYAYNFIASVDGKELDLSQCTIEVEITFTEKYRAYLNSLNEDQGSVDGEVSLMAISEEKEVLATAELDSASVESTSAATGMNVRQAATMSTRRKAAPVASTGSTTGYVKPDVKYTVSSGSKATGFTGLTSPVPQYQMEYYAYLNRPTTADAKGTNNLGFIDTSAATNGTATLPQNGVVPKRTYLVLDPTTGEVKFHKELTQIYKMEGTMQYTPRQKEVLSTQYLNRVLWKVTEGEDGKPKYEMRDDRNYELTEVWVKEPVKEGSGAQEEWWIYTTNESVTKDKLTQSNNALTAAKPEIENYRLIKTASIDDLKYVNNEETWKADEANTILICQGTIIRMVYDVGTREYDNDATFYDYNICDSLYNNSDGGLTMVTYKDGNARGINSPGNYSGDGVKFAFGNANTGTGLDTQSLSGNTLNKYNKNNSNTQGCTFGIAAKELKDKKTFQFASGVQKLALFDNTGVNGKRVYPKGNLGFTVKGDTYTLTSAQVTGPDYNHATDVVGKTVTNLDRFTHPQSGTDGPIYNGTTNHGDYRGVIWTNSFWPMDSFRNKDWNFGLTTSTGGYDATMKFDGEKKNGDGNWYLPRSDDGKNHNSYFGMKTTLLFTLDADYVGPLEYFFYGDDDLWVYLDGKLVCDIGGVHSSEGEYVNLWDYMDESDKAKEHILSIFYTERGASGSTCWMQFTVPNAAPAPLSWELDQSTTSLKVQKLVSGNVAQDPDKPYTLNVQVDTEDNLYYDKYDANNELVEKDVLLLGLDKSGVSQPNLIKLKDREYIIVKEMGLFMHYRVTEVFDEGEGEDCSVTWSITTPKANGGENVATGKGLSTNEDDKYTRLVQGENKVVFTNTYTFELPKTGGAGTWYTMAGLPLTAAAFCLMYKKKSEGRGAEDRA